MTPTSATMHVDQIADRAAGYNIPGCRVDGNDPVAVFLATSEAVERARNGGGPSLIECVTYRFFGHFFGDQMAYMPKDELEAAINADPVDKFRDRAVAEGWLTTGEVEEIDAAARAEVDEALKVVLASPPPDLAEIDRDIYAGGVGS
jgi:pyruvate dehydrogenase E1 component alpha subunit